LVTACKHSWLDRLKRDVGKGRYIGHYYRQQPGMWRCAGWAGQLLQEAGKVYVILLFPAQDFWTDFTNSVDVFSMGEVLHGNTR
jgi:hypothetical protein